eukprot:3980436-Pleurochrysis_carterae.AAC.1
MTARQYSHCGQQVPKVVVDALVLCVDGDQDLVLRKEVLRLVSSHQAGQEVLARVPARRRCNPISCCVCAISVGRLSSQELLEVRVGQQYFASRV